jgi:hypothetical protein
VNRENLQFFAFVAGILLGAGVLWYFGNIAGALALIGLLLGQQLTSYSASRKKGTNPIIEAELTKELRIIHANLSNENPEVAVRDFEYIEREGMVEALRTRSKKLVQLLGELTTLMERPHDRQTEYKLIDSIMDEIAKVLAQ